MPAFTVPLHEFNACHDPATGEFCSGGDRGDVSLARPEGWLMGLDSMRVSHEAVFQLLERDGREFTAQPLPEGYKRGTPHECYANATRLVMDNHLHGDGTLQYAEGILYVKGNRTIGVLHGWAVTPDGKVIDPTIDHPEQHRYFGLTHDQTAYMAYMLRSKTYGVLGGDDKASARWLKKRGIPPLQMDPRIAELHRRLQQEQERIAHGQTQVG